MTTMAVAAIGFENAEFLKNRKLPGLNLETKGGNMSTTDKEKELLVKDVMTQAQSAAHLRQIFRKSLN